MATKVEEPQLDEVDAKLEMWEQAGLISRDQTISIREFEKRPPQEKRSLVVEVLVYLGVAAILGAAVALLAQQWDDFGFAGRLALFVGLAAVAGVSGAILRGTGNTPTTRAKSVLWTASVGFTVGAGAMISDEYLPDQGWQTMLVVAGPAWLLASWYWVYEKRPLQLLAASATFVTVVLALADFIFGEVTPTIGGMTAAGLGAVGIAVTLRGWVPPKRFAELLYAAMVLFGINAPASAEQPDALWAEVLGVVVAAGLLALSVKVRSVWFLGAGGVGLFVFLTTIVLRHFAEQLGVPLALLICGVGLIGAALLVARLRPLMKESAPVP